MATPPAERILNLIIALVNARTRYRRADIWDRVAGYKECESLSAFERMFERDKQLIREMGIPLITTGEFGNADDIGYLLDKTTLRLADLHLSAAERGVLNLAARFWRNQVVATDAAAGAAKLSATAGGEESDVLAGIEPTLANAGTYVRPLLNAIAGRQEVEFYYRSPRGKSQRHVQPWRLYAHGAWYLLAYDLHRQAVRSFRLSRIEGKLVVCSQGAAFPAPSAADIAAGRDNDVQEAQLAILPGHAYGLRARGTPAGTTTLGADHYDLVRVSYRDVYTMSSEIVAYGPYVIVLSPLGLRTDVITRLSAAADWDRNA